MAAVVRPYSSSPPKSSLKAPRSPDSAQNAGTEDNSALPYRASKPVKIVQFQITTDDLGTFNEEKKKKPVPLQYRKVSTWAAQSQTRPSGNVMFDTTPTLTRTPWEERREQPKASQKPRNSAGRRRGSPKRMFQRLPSAVQWCILDELEAVHTTGLYVDVVRLNADLRSLCRIDKGWHRVAREYLYSELWLPSGKLPKKRVFSLHSPRSRLQVLLDTFKKSPWLATLVRRMRVSSDLAAELNAELKSPSPIRPVLQTLLEIIEQCTDLEDFDGYVPPVGPPTMPLIQALASCSQLRSHVWNLDPRRAILPKLGDFIAFHDNWTHLETLALSANRDVDLGLGAVPDILLRLPALKHLIVSGVHENDFNDRTLSSLPALKSLRLENLIGLTDHGVEQLATSKLRSSLSHLALVGLELVSLRTVHSLLARLGRLRKFVFVQEISPDLPTSIRGAERPLAFGSRSLKHLHWDCLLPGPATALFAEAIEANKFPRLELVKIPCDYDGKIQALCKPIPRERLTAAELEYLAAHDEQKFARSLRLSQIEAQLRVRKSRQQSSGEADPPSSQSPPRGRFLGSASSQIEYSLEAEVRDRALATFDDIIKPAKVSEAHHGMEQKLGVRLLL